MEFYIYNDELWCISDNGANKKVSENDYEFVSEMIDMIQSRYPDAYEALQKCYSKSRANVPYFQFLIVRRFLKCNFGELDCRRKDISDSKVLDFEHVRCPMRGECPFEGIICLPKFNSRLSDMEKRVMREVFNGLSNEEIASKLYISYNTIKKHIFNSYAKIGVHEKAEFIKYAVQHSLFEG